MPFDEQSKLGACGYYALNPNPERGSNNEAEKSLHALSSTFLSSGSGRFARILALGHLAGFE